MAAPDSTVFQFNFKVGNDLHNIYATNGGEAVELLSHFEEVILPALASVTQKISGVSAVAASLPVAPAATQTITAPASGGDSDAGAVHTCAHGQPMKMIPAGISKKTGKPYKAFYVCAQPQGMQCDTTIRT